MGTRHSDRGKVVPLPVWGVPMYPTILELNVYAGFKWGNYFSNNKKEFQQRMKVTEDQHQLALMTWARRSSLPDLDLLFHVPNGGQRSKTTAARLKCLGVKAGVADLFLPAPRAGKHGLWVELKAERGRLSPEQREWLEKMEANGYAAHVCFGWEAARDVIVEYLEAA